MNWIEPIAVVLGILSVYLLVKRNIWAFPIGIVMVALYIVIFYQARFYSDVLLQVVYIFMQIHGWYTWHHSAAGADNRIEVLRMTTLHWRWTILIQLAGALALGKVMSAWTDASLPWVDAFTTTMSLLAQWWMNRKFLENWILWITVDAIYLYQYTAKELYLTTLLYAVFLVLAVMGYREWKYNYRVQQVGAHSAE
jgi:nicotinamide mononucleotide transporter